MPPHHSTARHRQLLWLVAIIAAAGAGLFSLPWRWLAHAEDSSIDLRFQARGGGRAEPASIIVGVDDSSFTLAERAPAEAAREPLASMAATWPWNRRVYAEVVRKLRASGARAIVFDFLFDAENAGDAEFARVLAEPGAPVVLASLIQVGSSALGEDLARHQQPSAVLFEATQGRTGYANVEPDFDGVLRSFASAKQQQEFMGRASIAGAPALPSLAQAAVQAVRPGAATAAPRAGYINFSGPPGTIPTLPIEDLFLPDRWNNAWLQSGRLFRDRIVWVGMLSEVQFKDVYVTPLGPMAGVEAQAQIAETLLGAGPLQPFSVGVTRGCVWVLALAGVVVAWTSLRVSRQLGIVVAVALAWGALAYALFVTAGRVLPFVAPVAAWLIAGGGGVGVRFIMEQRERRRLRGVLGRYVSEEVARIIVDQPDEFSRVMRGGRRPVTVLFADLRGFTSWVEKAEPEAFVAQLNEYFSAVVDCVLAQGGTLQKFIGDALLAVWGDTRSAGAAIDTARAVDAALAMQAAVIRLNAGWAGRPDRTPMAIGIGLHHGVAMVGNVGHAQRMEFTVLGDVVNVAARLESANRQLDTTILVSEAIRDLTRDSHRCLPLGRYGLKGRREAVGLLTPLGPAEAPAPDWLVPAGAALAAWTAGDFAAAGAAYADLARPPLPLSEFFQHQADRARQLAAAPPPDWKGEYRFDSK